MKYTNMTLLQDEQLCYATSPHPIIFITPLIIYCIALFFYTDSYQLLNFPFVLYGKALYQWVGIGCFLVALFLTLGALITFLTTEYTLTNKRVIIKVGLIQRNSIELFLNKIEAIYVNQSILGRILNYGSLVIVGTGGSKDLFSNVPKPLEFRQRIQQEIDRYLNPRKDDD